MPYVSFSIEIPWGKDLHLEFPEYRICCLKYNGCQLLLKKKKNKLHFKINKTHFPIKELLGEMTDSRAGHR